MSTCPHGGTLLAAAVVFVMSFAEPALAATLSASQLVEGYERSLAPFTHVTYTAESRVLPMLNGQRVSSRKMYGVRDDEQGRAVFRMFYRRDGNRIDILSLKEGVQPGPSAWGNPELHLQRVIVDGSAAILDYANLTDRVHDALISQRTPTNFVPADSFRLEVVGNLRGGEPLDGFLMSRFDKSMPEILRGATDLHVREALQKVGEYTTYVLECTDGGYAYQVYIDPEAGFNPRKPVQRRIHPEADGADVVVDKIDVERVGDNLVAVAAHTSWIYRNGAKYLFTWDAQYRRYDINYHPNFPELLAFKMVIRPGTRVRNDDFPEIAWNFTDGRLVPAIDASMVNSIDHTMAALRASGTTAATSENGSVGRSPVAPSESRRPLFPVASDSENERWVIVSLTLLLSAAAVALLCYRLRSRGRQR